MGLPKIGSIGFGWLEVSGRSLVPAPPAMTTAFMLGEWYRAKRYPASARRVANPAPRSRA